MFFPAFRFARTLIGPAADIFENFIARGRPEAQNTAGRASGTSLKTSSTRAISWGNIAKYAISSSMSQLGFIIFHPDKCR